MGQSYRKKGVGTFLSNSLIHSQLSGSGLLLMTIYKLSYLHYITLQFSHSSIFSRVERKETLYHHGISNDDYDDDDGDDDDDDDDEITIALCNYLILAIRWLVNT